MFSVGSFKRKIIVELNLLYGCLALLVKTVPSAKKVPAVASSVARGWGGGGGGLSSSYRPPYQNAE